MKIFKKLFSFGTILLMIASITSVHAEVADITQTNSWESTATELYFHIQNKGLSKPHNHKRHTVMNQKQNQQQYSDMNQQKKKESNSVASFMNRINNTDRYTQGNAATGSMNRQKTATRSIIGGRYAIF